MSFLSFDIRGVNQEYVLLCPEQLLFCSHTQLMSRRNRKQQRRLSCIARRQPVEERRGDGVFFTTEVTESTESKRKRRLSCEAQGAKLGQRHRPQQRFFLPRMTLIALMITATTTAMATTFLTTESTESTDIQRKRRRHFCHG